MLQVINRARLPSSKLCFQSETLAARVADPGVVDPDPARKTGSDPRKKNSPAQDLDPTK